MNPARIKEARVAAGLTMAELAGGEVSRTFIHQIEHGVARPSSPVLELIARRTGKPVRYFTRPANDGQVSKQALASDLAKLSARLRLLRDNPALTRTHKQAVMMLELTLRQGAVLVRSL